MQETTEQKKMLFLWQQHNLYTRDNGFGTKHSQYTPARRIVLQIAQGEPQIIEIFACEDDAERIRQARQIVNIRLFDPTIPPYAYSNSVALATETVTMPPTDQTQA